jgi:hypothetical protein
MPWRRKTLNVPSQIVPFPSPKTARAESDNALESRVVNLVFSTANYEDTIMDKKTFGIGIMSLTAVAMFIATLFAPRPAVGIEAVANDDMQAVTCRYQGGGDALYLLDQSSGKLAVFTVASRGGLKLQTVADLESGFRESGAMGNEKGGKK